MIKDYRIFAICLTAPRRNEYFIRAVLAQNYNDALSRAKTSVMRKYSIDTNELSPVISHSVSMEEVESQLAPAEDRIKLNEIVAADIPSQSEKDKLIQSIIQSNDIAQIEQHELTLYEKRYIKDRIKENNGVSEGVE